MAKSIEYSESIPEQTSKHLVVRGHGVYFCFDVDQSTPVKEHTDFLDSTLVPFIIRAVKRLGPGTYNLIMHGSASATGQSTHNFDLGSRRATNIFNEIDKRFDQKKKTDSSLSIFQLEPMIIDHGDEESEKDPLLSGARKKGPKQVEHVQAIYRSAIYFTRAKQKKSSTFSIREIYFFKFKKIEEPLPQVLKQISDFLDKPVPHFIFGQLKDRLLKPVKEAFGELSFLAGHMVSYLVPSTADYCFEIKDSLKEHALYRFNGIKNEDKYELLDLIGMITKIRGVSDALKSAAKKAGLAKKLFSISETISKVTDELVGHAYPILEKRFGREIANQIRDAFLTVREGARKLFTAISVPGSEFTPFRFHDGGSDHALAGLAGPARRIAVDAGYHSSVEIYFGGSASPRSTEWMAYAHIVTGFQIRNAFFAMGRADGSFILLKSGYLTDIAPGLYDPVTG
ncbi:MAG: hypothetical protein JO015_10335 [Verrucomicrobia bacterium]|nr:hypothetical protein [Verrucomicrobiota bacterium]